MENLNAIRKIDELSRIILPKEFMKDMGWNIRDSLLMTYNTQSGIATLKLHEKAYESKDIDFCEDCLENMKRL